MKKFSKLALAFAASFMMFSCSNEEPAPDGGEASKGGVYATITLALPQGRSTTTDWDGNTNSSSGFEVGLDTENTVGSVLVILADENNGTYSVITSELTAANLSVNPANSDRPTYNVQFQSSALVDKAGEKVYVFAIANPNTELIAAQKAGLTDLNEMIGDINKGEIWGANSFMMANDGIYTINLPTLEEMQTVYNTESNPFNLGTINVSRVTARFDFKQTTIDAELGANKYPIYNLSNDEYDEDGNLIGTRELLGYVELESMSLLTVSHTYYYLPRVSANIDWTDPVLCGRETPNNYVVSTNKELKLEKVLPLQTISGQFDYSAFTDAGLDFSSDQLNYQAFNVLSTDDNPDDSTWGKDLTAAQKADYKIWQYVTENTIPVNNVGNGALFQDNNQRKAVTTGVAFKGYITPVEGSEVAADFNGTNVIYAYEGVLYGSFETLKKYAKSYPTHPASLSLKEAYNITNETIEADNEAIDAITTANDTDLVENGFTIYRPENGKYPVYYAYYNRHNDNGNPTIMGPMEFGTVRNNVYKLAVQNIMHFGHPAKPGDDPDPEDPDDPDEKPQTYFRVQVRVLPWVVRVNDIIL